jgi:uncharacterized membrane protein
MLFSIFMSTVFLLLLTAVNVAADALIAKMDVTGLSSTQVTVLQYLFFATTTLCYACYSLIDLFYAVRGWLRQESDTVSASAKKPRSRMKRWHDRTGMRRANSLAEGSRISRRR